LLRLEQKEPSFLIPLAYVDNGYVYGMDGVRGYGLKGMQTQAKLTALATNLKRIASLLSLNLMTYVIIFSYLLCINAKCKNYPRIFLKIMTFSVVLNRPY
jgi:hypothetical protein